MNESQGAKERYLTAFDQLKERLPGGGAPWVRALRDGAASQFDAKGFPTPRLEDWKYTNVGPIEKRYFEFPEAGPARPTGAWLQDLTLNDFEGAVLVFVNGRFCPAGSRLSPLPEGVAVGPLADALENGPEPLSAHLGRYADPAANAFAALNTALMEEGAYIHVPAGTSVDAPVLLVYAVTGERQLITHPRNLIVTGDNSRLAVIEHYVGIDASTYFTNAVTEVVAGPGAVVDHYKLQRESEAAYHVATLQVHQGKDSRFTSRNFSLGARLARNDINVLLGAAGADCTLDGLYMARGRQHVDNHTYVDHAVSHCSSREYYKGVLDGRGRAVFNGRIMVRQDAQQTDAHQSNHNLLLSESAEVDTKPQLEIFADDVKCSHGATVGHLDGDALFYLRSRGVDERSARSLLTYAFARELVGRAAIPPVRALLERQLLAWLPGIGEAAGELP